MVQETGVSGEKTYTVKQTVKFYFGFFFYYDLPRVGFKSSQELHYTHLLQCMLQIFREVAYKGRTKEDILAGIDEFMEQVTVLPPGEWDPKIRIEPPTKTQSQVIMEQGTLSSMFKNQFSFFFIFLISLNS